MTKLKVFILTIPLLFLNSLTVYAQGMGEYGRTLGGVAQRQRSASPDVPRGQAAPKGKGKGSVQGIGDVGGRTIPSGLIVAAQQTGLYPRQDDEAEKIEQLSQGDTLTPIVQSNGGNEWYMVKTQKGLIGWVKSSDVRDDRGIKR